MNARENVAPFERWLSAVGAAATLAGAVRWRRHPLGVVCALTASELAYRAITGYCPLYALVGLRSQKPRTRNRTASVAYGSGVRVEQSVAVARPALELYAFWRQLETLPRFMQHVEEVTLLTERRSRWRVRAPIGSRVTWEAEIINDLPAQLIGWRSLPGAAIHHAGSVHFDERNGETVVRVVLEYAPPARYIGASVARIFGEEPHRQIGEDLRRFKELAERGEIPSVDELRDTAE